MSRALASDHAGTEHVPAVTRSRVNRRSCSLPGFLIAARFCWPRVLTAYSPTVQLLLTHVTLAPYSYQRIFAMRLA